MQKQGISEAMSAALCKFSPSCQNVAYDNCALCGRPTCRKHGKIFGHYGEYIICQHCGDNAPSMIAALPRQ
jgi:hypothetical protein